MSDRHDHELERLRQLTARGDAAAAWRLRQLAVRLDDDALFSDAAVALGDVDGLIARAMHLWSVGRGARVPVLMANLGLMLDDDMLEALAVLLHTANGRRRRGCLQLGALLGCLVDARTNALGFALAHGGARASGRATTTLCLAARLPLERATGVVAQVEVVDARDPTPPDAWFHQPWSPDPRENVDAVQRWARTCAESLDPTTFDTLARPVLIPTAASAPRSALTHPLATRVLDLIRASDGEAWREHVDTPRVVLDALRTLVAERLHDRALPIDHLAIAAVDEATARLARSPARDAALALRLDLLPGFRDDGARWLERTLACFEDDHAVLHALARRIEAGEFVRPVELGRGVPPMRLSQLLTAVARLGGLAARPVLVAARSHPRGHVRRHAAVLLGSLGEDRCQPPRK